jgi:uncharacterized membrane protein YeaQ/YmgE (transglycosylase-associated protein family)
VQNYAHLGVFAVAGVIGAMLALYSTTEIDTELENEFWFLGLKSSMVPVPVLIALWILAELGLYQLGMMPVSILMGSTGACISGMILTIGICTIKQNPLITVSVAPGTTE